MITFISGKRACTAGMVIVSLVIGGGCGTRLSRAQIIAASRGAGVASGQSGVGSSQVDAASGGLSGSSNGGAVGSTGDTGSGSTAGSGNTGAVSGATGGASSASGAVVGNASAGSGAASPGGAASGGGGGNGSPIKQANLSPILIGNIGEYSGVVGASIGTGQPTVGVTVKWINDHGGLNGHPIKMFSADDGTDPGRYQALAQQMVEIQHVVAFLANLVPLSAPGADAYLNQKKVPVVGGDLANALEFQSPMVFPEGTSLATLAIGTAKLAVAQGKPKMAVFWCAEAAVCHQFNAAMTSPQASPTGVQIVYDAQVSLAQPDYTAECLKAESSGAQTIMLAVDANSMERAARSCVQNGVKPLWVSASLAVINAEAKDADLNGLTAPVPTFPWVASDIPTAQTYQAALQHYAAGVETSSGSAAVWTSGMLLMKASANLPANNPTSADILKGLWAIHNDNLGGLTTSLTFHQDGLPTVPSCFFYLVVQGGRWVAPVGSQQQCL